MFVVYFVNTFISIHNENMLITIDRKHQSKVSRSKEQLCSHWEYSLQCISSEQHFMPVIRNRGLWSDSGPQLCGVPREPLAISLLKWKENTRERVANQRASSGCVPSVASKLSLHGIVAWANCPERSRLILSRILTNYHLLLTELSSFENTKDSSPEEERLKLRVSLQISKA